MATSHQIAISQAIDAVVRVESPMQFRQASRLFNVPKTSLIDYVWEFRKIQYDRTSLEYVLSLKKRGRPPLIEKRIEDLFAARLGECADRGFPVTRAPFSSVLRLIVFIMDLTGSTISLL